MHRYEREHLLNILDSMHKDYRPNFLPFYPSSILLDLLLKSTTPRFIALANGADEAGHCADFVGAVLDHHFLLLFSLTCARSRTKQTNCSTYCLSNVNSRTLPFCALLRHDLTHWHLTLPLPHRATLCLEPTDQANCRAKKGVVEYASLSIIGGAMTQLLCPLTVLLNLNHAQLTANRSTRLGNSPVLF